MNRKEKTQQNRYDTKIAPVLEQLSKLCEKFEMSMITSIQLYENEKDGARVATQATHPEEMSLPMSLSTSLLRGTTKVRVGDNNAIQLIMPKNEMPENLKQYARDAAPPSDFGDDGFEPLTEHAKHCNDCNTLMEESIARGERVDNILVPSHDDTGLIELIDELRKSKVPFIAPKNNTIH